MLRVHAGQQGAELGDGIGFESEPVRDQCQCDACGAALSVDAMHQQAPLTVVGAELEGSVDLAKVHAAVLWSSLHFVECHQEMRDVVDDERVRFFSKWTRVCRQFRS